jgi:hypothetical protein
MKTNRVLFVDDVRVYPHPEQAAVLTVRNSHDAIATLENVRHMAPPGFEVIWLDFDLGGTLGVMDRYDTAMPVVLYLAEEAFYGTPYPVEKIYIHTGNPVGREAMRLTLDRFGYTVFITESI